VRLLQANWAWGNAGEEEEGEHALATAATVAVAAATAKHFNANVGQKGSTYFTSAIQPQKCQRTANKRGMNLSK